MVSDAEQPEPDTKDWTWVLDRPCPDCGLDARSLRVEDLPALLGGTTRRWSDALGRPDARERPSPAVWSPLEYGAHVRDVHVLFAERVRLMLEEDGPHFASWDQDATAVSERYAEQDPDDVRQALAVAAARVGDLYAGVTDEARDRPGYRSDGSAFTVETLGRYHLHDVVHHLWDVAG
jgi:hypothetical protein